VIGSGNSPQKHVRRAQIVLLSADGVGTMAIQRQTGKGKPTIRRWQARFMAEGIDGLLHEATRPAGKPPLSAEMIERLVAMTLAEPPGETDIEADDILDFGGEPWVARSTRACAGALGRREIANPGA
jgi:transposase